MADSIGPNNDGFDPDACDTVLCENVEFNTGDDCIAIKSGKNLDIQYGPSQNLVIQNCIDATAATAASRWAARWAAESRTSTRATSRCAT